MGDEVKDDEDDVIDPRNTMSVLVATDLHVGYKEKHDIRGGMAPPALTRGPTRTVPPRDGPCRWCDRTWLPQHPVRGCVRWLERSHRYQRACGICLTARALDRGLVQCAGGGTAAWKGKAGVMEVRHCRGRRSVSPERCRSPRARSVSCCSYSWQDV